MKINTIISVDKYDKRRGFDGKHSQEHGKHNNTNTTFSEVLKRVKQNKSFKQ